MISTLNHNPFSTSEILFWIEVRLWGLPQDFWWNVAALSAPDPELLSARDRQVPSHPSYLSTWYTFPVVDTFSYPTRRLKIIHPLRTIFKYQQRNISGYLEANSSGKQPYTYTYHWILPTKEIKLQPNPTPCECCGWYCNQVCKLKVLY